MRGREEGHCRGEGAGGCAQIRRQAAQTTAKPSKHYSIYQFKTVSESS